MLDRLSPYKCCEETCPYHSLGNEHPRGARGNANNYNTAAIPEGLAELVAAHVDSKLFMDRIPDKTAVVVTEEDIEELNSKLREI